ncbi:hypothetical protein FPZ41_21665 [Streptomyces sp. K1PN6]|uniref:Uncharacterized protein n=1 Tax=Streptomyces acidicola TaxID=2596892 RepID=A0A5N8WWW5_9ACTN|nr:hypothetical protein [Streptomyces acidicola]
MTIAHAGRGEAAANWWVPAWANRPATQGANAPQRGQDVVAENSAKASEAHWRCGAVVSCCRGA